MMSQQSPTRNLFELKKIASVQNNKDKMLHSLHVCMRTSRTPLQTPSRPRTEPHTTDDPTPYLRPISNPTPHLFHLPLLHPLSILSRSLRSPLLPFLPCAHQEIVGDAEVLWELGDETAGHLLLLRDQLRGHLRGRRGGHLFDRHGRATQEKPKKTLVGSGKSGRLHADRQRPQAPLQPRKKKPRKRNTRGREPLARPGTGRRVGSHRAAQSLAAPRSLTENRPPLR